MSQSFMKFSSPTISGRVYPEREIVNAVSQINEQIDGDLGAFMTLDDYGPRGLSIPLDRVAGRLTKVWIENGHIMGDFTSMGTPMGKVYDTLTENGITLHYKLAMTGMVDESGQVSDLRYHYAYVSAKP
jgi:hypothetical protein